MDVDFSLLEIPEATQLNFESSKHKRTLSKKGSFAHRKSPTRATTRPRSQEISFLDSTGDEPPSNQIDSNDARIEEPDNNSQLENSVQEIPGAGRRVTGLVGGLRASQVQYTENRTIPQARVTTSPASDPTTSPASSPTTTSAATLDTSADSQNPHPVLPKSVPDMSQKSAITGDEEGIGAFSLPARRTRRSEGSKFLEDSGAGSQVPSSKAMLQFPSMKDVKTVVITDPPTLPLAASILMPHLEYSQGIPKTATSQSVEVQPRLRHSEVLQGTETRHFEVTKKSYQTKLIDNPKSTQQNPDSPRDNPKSTQQNPDSPRDNPTFTPRNPDSSKDNPKSTQQNPDSIKDNPRFTPRYPDSTKDNPKSTPGYRSKTTPVFTSTEHTRQNTNKEKMSLGAFSIVPTAAPELKYCTVDNTNLPSKSSSKTGSKYWPNPTFDVSEASGKNSAGLNSKMAAVDISNRTDQKRLVYSTTDSQKPLSFGETRVTSEYNGGNNRQKGQHENSKIIENKREDSGNVLNVTGFSESERADPKQFVVSSSSVEVCRNNPCVMATLGEVTIVCSLDHSLGGIKSAVVARDNGTDSAAGFTECCLTTGSLQSTGLPTGVAITNPATDHTPGSSLTPSTGRTLREGDVTHQEERSDKVGMHTSSFCMQLRGGYKPGDRDLGRVGVDTRILPERTFTFSFTPKTDSNTSLNIVSKTKGGQG